MPILNIHPLVVHTPLGLLSIYTLLEIISIKKLRALPYWFYVKAVLAIIGAGGAAAAYFTGDMLREQFTSPLLEKHALFAIITLYTFALIAGGFLITWAAPWVAPRLKASWLQKIWHILEMVAKFLQHRVVSAILAVVGLTVLTITGALGGALVYGSEADPVVSVIYHWFFPT